MIKDKSIQTFLNELASKSSTPGGGSAAAIMGAMGAALVSMVCNLTIGKKDYAEVEEELKLVLVQAEALRERLTDMIQADVEVFDQVMRAYTMPKETQEQKALRSDSIQSALKAATEVPLNCARACAETIRLSRTVAQKGNCNVITDAGVAGLAAYAALQGAALNVYVNVKGIKDKTFVEERLTELKQIMEGSEALTDEVYQLVKSNL